MDLQLRGKRALITGSTSGIGEAIAKALAAEGVSVVIHGRQADEARRVSDEIIAATGQATVALGDLGSDESAATVADKALAAFGGIDILVNNAGAYSKRDWFEIPPADWNDLYNRNIGSMVRMIQILVPGMKTRGWGRVIAMSSAFGIAPKSTMPSYAATKVAALNLAVSLAKELVGTGITSNAVSPGPILTGGLEQSLRRRAAEMGWSDDWAEIESRYVNESYPNPSNRVGRVEDVADMVTYLCSPRAGYVNGTNIRIDGGYVPTIN